MVKRNRPVKMNPSSRDVGFYHIIEDVQGRGSPNYFGGYPMVFVSIVWLY